MGTFNTKAVLYGDPQLIPAIADRICQEFAADGYEVKREDLISGGIDISLAKGGAFKAVVGMKTALKVTLVPQENSINFEAGVGIFGHQIVPTLVMWFFAWPVAITQIWGMVKQSKLDDKALAAARAVITEHGGNPYSYGTATASRPAAAAAAGAARFCTNCGAALPENAKFCSSCGKPL